MNLSLKILLSISTLFIFSGYSYAADENDTKTNWGNNTDVFQKGFENQEAVSNSKFQKTIDALKDRSLNYKQRKLREQVKPISPAYDEDHLRNFANDEDVNAELNNAHTVMIPVQAYNQDGKRVQPGYYKLSCRKISDNKYKLDLSQGTILILSVDAIQTQQDLEQDTINFCDADIISNGRIRLMFGSIDLNLVGYLYFEE